MLLYWSFTLVTHTTMRAIHKVPAYNVQISVLNRDLFIHYTFKPFSHDPTAIASFVMATNGFYGIQC